MKSVILAIGAFAALVAAQDTSGLPACAKTCADNMLAADKAQELGCKQSDYRCLCLNKDFIYGLRDCSLAVCQNNNDNVMAAVQFGTELCSRNGVQITAGGSEPTGSASGSNGGSGSGSTSGSAESTSGSGSGSGSGSNGGSASLTTISSTVTSGDTTFVTAVSTATVGSETTSGAGGSGGAGGSHVTVFTSDGTVITSTVTGEATGTGSSSGSGATATETNSSGSGSGSESTSAGESGGSATASASESSSSSANAVGPQMTAAPIAYLAAAGFAALLL